ncbi:MAG: Gfo/Idh/MocA family oxidoreductase [Terriglobia bacterium]|jgi:predicted dehydrogenase
MSALPIINAGLIGCGEVANRYGTLLSGSGHSGLRLTCATDVSDAEGRAFSDAFGLRFQPSLAALLTEPIELVCVCTPNITHAPIAYRCMEAGLHVLLEHPMAMSIDEAEKLRETARGLRRHLFVVRQRRFLATVQAVRAALDRGVFGEIRTVEASVYWSRRPEYFTERPWRADHDNGGVLLNQGSHFLDILLFLFGTPRAVEGYVGNIRHPIEVEDTARGAMHFAGFAAYFEFTTAAPEGWNRAHLRIEGTRHNVELGGQAWERFVGPVPDEILRLDGLLEQPLGGDHASYFERVSRRLAGEAITVVEADEGIRMVHLIDSIYAVAVRADADLAAYFGSRLEDIRLHGDCA